MLRLRDKEDTVDTALSQPADGAEAAHHAINSPRVEGSPRAALDLSHIFASFPALETERLRLRATTLDDADAVFDYASDPEVTEFMIFPRHESIQDSIDFLNSNVMFFARKESIGFAIVLKETGELIGTCSYHHIAPEHHRVEIGYVLRRAYWDKGYMSEVVRELIRFAFEVIGMHRVEAYCNVLNERSARVMERCGMSHEGTFRDNELRRGRFRTTKAYGILRTKN